MHLKRERLERPDRADPRIIDEHVEPAETIHSIANRFVPIGLARYVQSAVERMLAELSSELSALGIEDVGDRDPRALRNETARFRRSLSTGGSGSESDFSGEPIRPAADPNRSVDANSRRQHVEGVSWDSQQRAVVRRRRVGGKADQPWISRLRNARAGA